MTNQAATGKKEVHAGQTGWTEIYRYSGNHRAVFILFRNELQFPEIHHHRKYSGLLLLHCPDGHWSHFPVNHREMLTFPSEPGVICYALAGGYLNHPPWIPGMGRHDRHHRIWHCHGSYQWSSGSSDGYSAFPGNFVYLHD